MAARQGPVSERGKELEEAAQQGNLSRVVELLAEGCDADALFEALLAAVCESHAQVVRVLLEQEQTSINADYFGSGTLLHLAMEGECNPEIVELLLAHRDCSVNQVNATGCTPLHIACQHGQASAVQMLLAHPDISVNVGDQTARRRSTLRRKRGTPRA
jgi:ankyrin repeat protein